MMINYSEVWKNNVNLHQVNYVDFVSINFLNGIFMEKVDGMLGTLIYKDGKSFFQTTTGKVIFDIPVLDEYNKIFQNRNIHEAKIPGELVAKKNGKILPFNEIQSIVKRFKEPQNKNLIFHYPVDIISFDKSKLTFKQSLSIISKFLKAPHIQSPKIVFGTLKDFRLLYKETFKKIGFDGIVARNINGRNYKVKFTNTVDLVIIGAGHFALPSWPRKQISYLLTSFIDKKGFFRTSSKVGTGLTNADRSDFYKYIMSNKLYDLRGEVFVKPRLVIEVKYFRYRIVKTPTLIYTSETYDNFSNEKSITFSHPSFVRKREDKIANMLDVRLEQIPDFLY